MDTTRLTCGVVSVAIIFCSVGYLLRATSRPAHGDNRDNFGPSVVESFTAEPGGKAWRNAVRVIEVTGKTPMRLALVNHETGGLARVQVGDDVNVDDDIHVTAYQLETRLIPGTMNPPSIAVWYTGYKK